MLSPKQDTDTETLSSWQLCWHALGLFETYPIYTQSQRGERHTEPYALQFKLLALVVQLCAHCCTHQDLMDNSKAIIVHTIKFG